MASSRSILFSFWLSVFVCGSLLASGAIPEPKGTLKVGQDLTYHRGTAEIKNEVLRFPYYHRARAKKKCWASVVPEGKGDRLIVVGAEAAGVKDKHKGMEHQDFPKDHPFQKSLDLIKHDAFFKAYKELKGSKQLKKEDWKLLSVGGAVHEIFYKDSKGKIYCMVAPPGPTKESLSGPPMVLTFWRTQQGPMAAALINGSWSPPQKVAATVNVGTNAAFKFVEGRKGF